MGDELHDERQERGCVLPSFPRETLSPAPVSEPERSTVSTVGGNRPLIPSRGLGALSGPSAPGTLGILVPPAAGHLLTGARCGSQSSAKSSWELFGENTENTGDTQAERTDPAPPQSHRITHRRKLGIRGKIIIDDCTSSDSSAMGRVANTPSSIYSEHP